MRIDRRVVGIVLYGGWLLLFNPAHDRPMAPLSAWKKVDDYETAYECQQGLREKVVEADQERNPKKRLSPTDAALRYRCARREEVP
jgi:hypothetical protein